MFNVQCSTLNAAQFSRLCYFARLLYHAQWPPAIFNEERSMKYGTSAQKQEIKYETQNLDLCFLHQGCNDFMTPKNIILSVFIKNYCENDDLY